MLHAVIEWLTAASGDKNENFERLFEEVRIDATIPTPAATNSGGEGLLGGVVNSLSSLFKDSLGITETMPHVPVVDTNTKKYKVVNERAEVIHGEGVAAAYTLNDAPARRCSGIILHVFVNGPQVILHDNIKHPSVRKHSRDPKKSCYSVKWAKV